ncbi:HAD family hydrolase [Ectobacillus funiculus]|uniref:HAD family hydrolase n=1 Tax=Ectobacillus funiculus TaxID=137993 RepID=UPI00397A2048
MAIKAIFFDLDDTLHDHQKPFTDSLHKMFPEHAEILAPEDTYKKFRYFSDLLWEDYCQSRLTLEELRVQRMVLALKEYEISISNEVAQQFQLQYEAALNAIELFPEVPELLTTLSNQGFELGIITNGPTAHQRNKMKCLGITQYIPEHRIFVSDAVGHAKPDPRIFHEAAKTVDCAPEHILYIGDSWTNDIVGSSKAGWQSIWYNHRKRQPDTEHTPLAEIEQLLSILEIVKQG